MSNVSNFTIDGVAITVKDNNAVSTIANQGLTENQKANARTNIGAGDSSFSGDYNDLANLPDLKPVATSGSYNDLSNKPTIPTVNNATLTIQKNGTNVQTFTANSSSNKTANITVPTKVSELTNDSGYTTNTGTVTQVKVGNTAYNPSSGVVSLPAYPSDTNNRRVFYGTCATAAATAAKVITLSDTTGWELKAGTTVVVRFTYTNTASNVTLNVNSSGAKSIYYNTAAYTGSSSTVCGYANRTYVYTYDGTYWVWVAHGVDDNTTYSSKAAASGGTDVSLVTTGEKYTWNNKGTGTVTSVKVGSTSYSPSSGVVSLPAYPTVNNATLTIQKNGTNVETFTANSSSNKTANITVPTKVSELTNDSGYTTNTGTVTQVKVGNTAYNPSSGVVSLPAYPTVNNATLTIQKNGTTVKTFTANASSNVTANITVPTKSVLEVSPVTVACSNQVWKRLALITIPANCSATVTATISHSLANVGCTLSVGLNDANVNENETTIPDDARTFEYHKGNCTAIINNTSSSTQNVYANVWLTGGSGNVNLKAFRALIIK